MKEVLYHGLVLELHANGDRTYQEDFVANYHTDHIAPYSERLIKVEEYHQKVLNYITNVLKFSLREYRTDYAFVEYIQGPGTGKKINSKYMIYLVDSLTFICEARSLQEAIYIIDAISFYEETKFNEIKRAGNK